MANFVPFMTFVKSFNKVSVANLVNKSTGEVFNALMFTDNEGKNHSCFFAKSLGNLTAKQVAEKKHDLYIVRNDDGQLYCSAGSNTWEEVEL